MVTVIPAAFCEGPVVRLVTSGIEHLAARAVAGNAVAFEIGQMRH
jgi:hypothetical protein